MQIVTSSIRQALRPVYYVILVIFILFCASFTPCASAADNVVIELTGVDDAMADNINTYLVMDQASFGKTLSPNELQLFYKNAPATIQRALQPYGYFKSTIQSTQIRLKANTIKMHFFINLGKPVYITEMHLKIIGPGQTDPTIEDYVAHFPIHSGQILNTERYEKAKKTFFDIVNNQGYLKATFIKKELRIDLNNHSAVIILFMDTGQQYYFGQFQFNPNPFDPAFLNRFVHFNENEPFSSEKLLTFQEALNNSKYFQTVSVTPQLDQEQNNRIPTQIDVTAPKAQFYNFGLGYGTYTGPRVTLGVDFRRVTNTGQHFNAQVKYSSILKGLAAKYFIPGHDPLTEQYTVGANIQEFRPKTGKSFSETLSGSYTKTINPWTNTISLNLLNDRYNENNKPTETSHLLYPSYHLSHITADDLLNPQRGNAFHFIIQGSREEIFSTTSFIQTEIKDKFIFSPTEASRIILRGDIGYTVVNDLNQLPLTLNFFAGGLNSVRGYEYGSLGPGRYLETASVEYQHRIYGNWNGAVFYDAGNAMDHFNDPLMRGTGVGIVYHSMIGAIQVYVARAESKPNKPLSIEFTIGSDL